MPKAAAFHALKSETGDEALVMLTATPARAARVGDVKGQLKVGYDGDVVIFDGDFNVHRTLVGGRTVYSKEQDCETETTTGL